MVAIPERARGIASRGKFGTGDDAKLSPRASLAAIAGLSAALWGLVVLGITLLVR
jgi:hypothetical protein